MASSGGAEWCSSCQEPGACSTRLSTDNVAGLVIFTLMFTVLGASLPTVSAFASKRYFRKTMPEEGGQVHEDPPLFGLVPTTWATTGLGVLLFMLSVGFNAAFYFVITDTTGVTGTCRGPLGACGTISCIAGTYLVEVYIFMQVTLTLIPLLIVQQIGLTIMENQGDPWSLQRWVARIVIASLILVPLTGIFPARYETDPFRAASAQSNMVYRQLGYLHSLGVGVGAVVPVIVLFGVAVKRFVESLASNDTYWISPLSLAIRCVFILLIIIGFAIFLSLQVLPDTLDFCRAHKDENSCNGFLANLTATCNFDNLQETDEFFAQIRYTCTWDAFTPKPTHQKFLPVMTGNTGSACVRHQCDLKGNAWSVASEYVALILPVIYLSSFGLADLKHLFQLKSFVPYVANKSNSELQESDNDRERV